jgi:hypothetical protein
METVQIIAVYDCCSVFKTWALLMLKQPLANIAQHSVTSLTVWSRVDDSQTQLCYLMGT